LDLEATCDENVPSFEMETIEIGAAWIAADGVVLDHFQSFVRPIVNPRLALFCTQLTGITQADVDAAPLFPAAADALREFAGRHGGVSWGSWGAYDRQQIARECERHRVADPLAGLVHRNLKREFAKVRRIKEVGMARALQMVGLSLDGSHHRALDDALNVARLFGVIRSLPLAWRPSMASFKPPQSVTTNKMHETIGQHVKGEWVGGSPGFMDDGRGAQQQPERQRRVLARSRKP
jgi:inhibitor of KinA sporulation pathway (predicted exonuclease)